MIIFKKDITDAARPLQLSAGQEAVVEAVIDAMGDFLIEILIDAENAFNSISRKVMLHNLNFICPIITTYITNYYIAPDSSLSTEFQVYLSKCWDACVSPGCTIQLVFFCSFSALFQHVDLVTTSLRAGFQVYLS